jgi:murein DD-endopeptidase MepM/ murein hydrolase activator NlpD
MSLILLAYAEDVNIKLQQLSEVRKTIRIKEHEKEKFALQEKKFKKELRVLNDNIEQIEKKLQKCSLDIKTTQRNLENSSKTYNDAFSKSLNWNKIILDEIKLFNKMTFIFSYEQNPMEYKIRCKSLEYKKANFEKERKAVIVSAMDIKRWKKSKKDLLNLRQHENNLIVECKKVIKEKNELLNTTLGKRLKAEKELKALNESAKAMQVLINKINMSRTVSARVSTPKVKRKKSLPWPVDGKILAKFGKNKHPELDTYVINNGVKIAAGDFCQVKSIDSGIVVFTGPFRSYGKVVIIDHNNSTFSVYGLLERILVKDDQKVSQGTVIAELGSGKRSILYFEIRQNNIPDDPALWLQEK